MNLVQSEELDSQRAVKQIEVDFPQVLIDNPEYKESSDGLEASLSDADIAIVAQVTEADESIGTLELKKKDAANAVLDLLTRAKSVAIVSKDTNLQKLVTTQE